MCFCERNKLPPLTMLVVNANTGKPGEGCRVEGDMDAQREKVFKFDWFSVEPPVPEDFTETVRCGMKAVPQPERAQKTQKTKYVR